MATPNNNVTMNSNINNNKAADVSSPFRFTATAAMLPSAPQAVDDKAKKPQKRPKKAVILESLLLKNDE